jgi:ABC-2 type transport system ATP-binding protein
MTEAIAVSGLRKSYGKTVALDGLDLSVAEGEVHGFLGPNGSGKTTTIRILLGLLRADGGTARLLGGDPWHEATTLHRRLAYVPGDVTFWPSFTGGEIIDLLGRLRGGLDAKRRASLLERFDLDPTKKARTYSRGNRQKVALISALASDVELLILDEPTAGLDPLMEAAFRDCIEEEARSGRTVLLSSHILSEVEALCERVTIIRAGRTVESGTLAELRHLTRTSIAADLARAPAGLDQLPGVHDLDVQDFGASGARASGGPAAGRLAARVRCEVDTDKLDEVLRHLADAGVLSLVSQPPTLEELFLRHYAVGPDGPDGAPGAAEPAADGGGGQQEVKA